MEYRVGDILVCRQLFSFDENNNEGRVFDKDDVYEIIEVEEENIWIQQVNNEKFALIYADPIQIPIPLIVFFSCQRVERVLKLKEIR